jgi:hypothetical protein
MRRFNIDVPSVNEEGQRVLDSNHISLVYMPHCGNALYHNFVRTNWSPSSLSRVLLIGNSFENYQSKVSFQNPDAHRRMTNRTASSASSSSAPSSSSVMIQTEYCFLQLLPAVTESPLNDQLFDIVGVFNDTHVHRFEFSDCLHPHDPIWSKQPPIYQSADPTQVSELIHASVSDDIKSES